MDPYTLAAMGIGTAAGMLGPDGGDKFMSLKDRWGKHLVGDIKDLQQNVLDLPEQQFFEGQTYANLNPAITNAYNQMINFGSGVGGDVLSGQLMQGGAGLGNFLAGSGYMNQLQNQGGPQFGFDQGTYDQTLGNLLPTLQGTYADLTRDIDRNLMEQQIPGLNSAAAMSGNMPSTRAGVAQGIMERGAADRKGDIASQLTSNAVNQAQAAGMAGGMGNLRSDLSTMGNLLQGYGNFANIGLPGLMNAYNTGKGNIGMGLAGGSGFRDFEQLGIDEAVDRFNFQQQAPWQRYTDQLNLLSSTLPGGSQLPNNPSALDKGLQGAMTGLGLYNALNPTQAAGPLGGYGNYNYDWLNMSENQFRDYLGGGG